MWFSHLFDKRSVVLNTYTNNLLHVKLYAVMNSGRMHYITIYYIM